MTSSGLSSMREDIRKAISLEEVASLCRDLIRIPSENPPGSEADLARCIGSTMGKIGLEVEFDNLYPDRPNVYGNLRGSNGEPILILNGHTDVVPVGDGWTEDPHGGAVEGDRIYGRGSADMKGGLAAMLSAALIIKRLGLKLRGSLLITAVADEEIGQLGTKHYMDTKGKGDFAIVCEPTELSLCIAEKGQLMYEISVAGKAAHSSRPSEGINAIEKALAIIVALRDYSQAIGDRKHRLLGHPTINVGTIQGGTVTNIVPSNCAFTVDRRTLPNEKFEEVDIEFREIIEGLSRNDKNLYATLKRFFTLNPFETAENHLIVSTLRAVSRQVLGRDPPVRAFEAASDAAYLSPRIPTVVFGPGSLSQAHRPDEHCSISQIMEAALVYAGAAITLLE